MTVIPSSAPPMSNSMRENDNDDHNSSPPSSSHHHPNNVGVRVQRSKIDLLGWPTDTISVDYFQCQQQQQPTQRPHSMIYVIWIPGNPGQYDWYVPDMISLIRKLGRPGRFAARGISHASHGLFTYPTSSSTTTTTTTTTTTDYGMNDDNNFRGITNVKEYSSRTSSSTSNASSKETNPKQQQAADPTIPWTVEGQIQHKIAYIDYLIQTESLFQSQQQQNDGDCNGDDGKDSQQSPPRRQFLFIGHSFGCYVIQQMLLQRKDILQQTVGCVYLMPFIRMNANTYFNQYKLTTAAHYPAILIKFGTLFFRLLESLSPQSVDNLLRYSTTTTTTTSIADADESNPTTTIRRRRKTTKRKRKMIHMTDHARKITVQLMRQPTFVTNFFQLGTNEIRTIPRDTDIDAFRIIAGQNNCPIHMLYAGNDQWAPKFHMDDIQELQSRNVLPPLRSSSSSQSSTIVMTYNSSLKHDYVTNDNMSTFVVDWCYQSIQQIVDNKQHQQQQQQKLHQGHSERSNDRRLMDTTGVFLRSKL